MIDYQFCSFKTKIKYDFTFITQQNINAIRVLFTTMVPLTMFCFGEYDSCQLTSKNRCSHVNNTQAVDL